MAIAFDESDYAETASSASTLAVTGVTSDAGDFLVALASVFNSTGTTMAVSDPTNGTWTVPTGVPVLADANGQAHINYFTNAQALSAATVTFDPVGTSSDIDAAVVEISGADASGFDQYVEATGSIAANTTGTAQVTTGTLGHTVCLVFSVMTHTGSSQRTLTAGANYTLIAEDEDNASAQSFHSQRLTTATTVTTAVTADVAVGNGNGQDAGLDWGMAAIVVKEAVAGGGRTVLNTRSSPLGVRVGMGWRMPH